MTRDQEGWKEATVSNGELRTVRSEVVLSRTSAEQPIHGTVQEAFLLICLHNRSTPGTR